MCDRCHAISSVKQNSPIVITYLLEVQPVWVKRRIPDTSHELNEAAALPLETIFSLQLLFSTYLRIAVFVFITFYVVVMLDPWSSEMKCYNIHWHFCSLLLHFSELHLIFASKPVIWLQNSAIGLCPCFCIWPWSGGCCQYCNSCNASFSNWKWRISWFKRIHKKKSSS